MWGGVIRGVVVCVCDTRCVWCVCDTRCVCVIRGVLGVCVGEKRCEGGGGRVGVWGGVGWV